MEAQVRYTYADYCRLPDEERWQLIRGQLVREPAPTPPHQLVCMELVCALANAADPGSAVLPLRGGSGTGVVLASPIDVVLSDEDVLQPDVIFISQERQDIITGECIRGAPDLVAEILSPSTEGRDRGIKRELYAAHGVQEYWIVDPHRRVIEVYRPTGAGFSLHGTFGSGETLTTPLLPRLALNPARLFRRHL